MKKSVSIILTILIIFCPLIGCTSNNTKKRVINDKSIYFESFNPDGFSNVIQTSSKMDFEKIYNNLDELFEEAENVVYGTVKKIEYFDDTGVALTKYDFLIEKTYKGILNQNDLISILTSGGYVRLQKYIDAFGNGKFSDFSSEKIKQTVIKSNCMGSPSPRIEDKYLVFLSKPIQDEKPFPDGLYPELGTFMGRYYYKGNKLTRYKPTDEPYFYKDTNDTFSFEAIDKILKNKSSN